MPLPGARGIEGDCGTGPIRPPLTASIFGGSCLYFWERGLYLDAMPPFEGGDFSVFGGSLHCFRLKVESGAIFGSTSEHGAIFGCGCCANVEGRRGAQAGVAKQAAEAQQVPSPLPSYAPPTQSPLPPYAVATKFLLPSYATPVPSPLPSYAVARKGRLRHMHLLRRVRY